VGNLQRVCELNKTSSQSRREKDLGQKKKIRAAVRTTHHQTINSAKDAYTTTLGKQGKKSRSDWTKGGKKSKCPGHGEAIDSIKGKMMRTKWFRCYRKPFDQSVEIHSNSCKGRGKTFLREEEGRSYRARRNALSFEKNERGIVSPPREGVDKTGS